MSTTIRAASSRHLLATAGERGMTWREYAALSGGHHGSASGALSRMHADGTAVRLAERRDGVSVYVDPAYVNDRPTVTRRANSAKIDQAAVDAAVAVIELKWSAERAEIETLRAVERLEWEQNTETLKAEIKELQRQVKAAKRSGNERATRIERRHVAELSKLTADATARAREEGEAVGWQEGYDEGVKRGQETSGTGDFEAGREAGRLEGSDAMRSRVGAVSMEMYRVIMSESPVQAHFNGCWKVHPGCSIKALSRSAGIPIKPSGAMQIGLSSRAV